MRERDLSILKDLERFRCMSREDVADIHFRHCKDRNKNANMVLKRLRRDGYIDANTSRQPYVYFPKDSKMKRNSQKINHFLAIVNVYKQLLVYEEPRTMTIEPKYGSKGYMEPDMFVIWRESPFFIEIQKTQYTDKQMGEKLQRYEQYYQSGLWQDESWQKERKVFPFLLVISNTPYPISSNTFRIFQACSVHEFVEQMQPKQQLKQEIKVKLNGSNITMK